jgi:murein DD-endopeptidase MepM/ murein hydrolase activator NlpD
VPLRPRGLVVPPDATEREEEERVRAVLTRTASVAAVAAAVLPTAGPAVAAELGARTLERGDRGDDVRELQDTLSGIGLETVADGLFGAGTVASVRRYERDQDLAVDGRVTPAQARGLLRRAAAEAPPLRPDPPGGDQPAEAEDAFPVDGEHTYGDGFGDRPGHRGADVLAACGTPLRAVAGATVRKLATEGSAGRYVVLHDGESGDDYVYMHLSDVAVSSGERVRAGERVGSVGQTGNATTCHLHFERWSAPGWYDGGSPNDPVAFLRSLAAA